MKFMAVGQARKLRSYSTQGFKETAFDSSGFSEEETFTSASALPHYEDTIDVQALGLEENR